MQCVEQGFMEGFWYQRSDNPFRIITEQTFWVIRTGNRDDKFFMLETKMQHCLREGILKKSNSSKKKSGAGIGESSRTRVQGRDTGLNLKVKMQDAIELGLEQGLSEPRAKLEDRMEPGSELGLRREQ